MPSVILCAIVFTDGLYKFDLIMYRWFHSMNEGPYVCQQFWFLSVYWWLSYVAELACGLLNDKKSPLRVNKTVLKNTNF